MRMTRFLGRRVLFGLLTLLLVSVVVLVSTLIALPLSIFLGVIMAVRRDRPTDHALSLATLTLAALPEFVIGIALVLLFATNLSHILPAVSIIPPGEHAWNVPNAVI